MLDNGGPAAEDAERPGAAEDRPTEGRAGAVRRPSRNRHKAKKKIIDKTLKKKKRLSSRKSLHKTKIWEPQFLV